MDNESETPLVYPVEFQVVRREGNEWKFSKSEVFYNPSGAKFDLNNIEQAYGLTKSKIAIACFRINGGKPGYYLVNMKDKQHYYCGESKKSVREKLRSLGIGRPDPREN